MTISKSAWRGLKRGSSAPNRSISYGDIDSDMYSIAQHAVAKGYGKSEYLRAQPTALSRRVNTTVSERSFSCPKRDWELTIGCSIACLRSSRPRSWPSCKCWLEATIFPSVKQMQLRWDSRHLRRTTLIFRAVGVEAIPCRGVERIRESTT